MRREKEKGNQTGVEEEGKVMGVKTRRGGEDIREEEREGRCGDEDEESKGWGRYETEGKC